MSIQFTPIARSVHNAASGASAGGVDLYEGRHGRGTRFVAVAAYRVGEVWKPYLWSWFSPDGDSVVLEVPASTDMGQFEVLVVY